ncbi:hypothetical protein ACOME3_003398 [Neoechinorhynchus agilis]
MNAILSRALNTVNAPNILEQSNICRLEGHRPDGFTWDDPTKLLYFHDCLYGIRSSGTLSFYLRVRSGHTHQPITNIFTFERRVMILLQHQITLELLKAVRSNDKEAIRRLCAIHGNGKELINRKHASTGTTPLMVAAMINCVEMIEFLLELGADVDLKNSLGMTAFLCACQLGSLEVIECLLGKYPHLKDNRSDDGNDGILVHLKHSPCNKMILENLNL